MDEPFSREEKIDEFSKRRRASLMVHRFMERSDRYRTPHLELARRGREFYNTWNKHSRSTIRRSNLQLPFAYQLVEEELPQLTEPFFSDKQPIRFKGRDREDMNWNEALSDHASMQLEQMGFQVKFISFCKGMLIDGTAIAKIPYKFEEIFGSRDELVLDDAGEPVIDPETGDPVTEKVPFTIDSYDGPDYEKLPLIDFFPDWQVKSPGDIKSMRGCVHRTYQTFSDLKNSGNYTNLNEVKTSVGRKGISAWKKPHWVDEFDDNDHKVKEEDKIEIWEYWGLFDPKNDGNFQEFLITIANGDVVIRLETNFYDLKFKPFIACVNVLRDNEFYGISEVLAVSGFIREANTLRNARLDQVHLSINRMFVIDRGAGILPDQTYTRPNGIVWADDINGMRELPPPDPPASAFSELTQLSSDIQTTAGQLGGPSLSQAGRVFGRSATGASLVQSIASSRARTKIRLLAGLHFVPMAQIMMKTNAQFVDQELWVRVSDPDVENPYQRLEPSAFTTNYDFEITTNVETSPQEEASQIERLISLLQVAESTQPGITDFQTLWRKYGRKVLGRDIKQIFRTPQEMLALQQSRVAAEQAGAAAAGQRAPQNPAGSQF